MFHFLLRFNSIFAVVALSLSISTADMGKDIAWRAMTDEQRRASSLDLKAYACGITPREFEFMSRVVEMESDRSQNIEGRIYIAATIINRVNDGRFPNDIESVLTQSGQFSTVSGGWCSQKNTELSDWAIVEAYRRLASEDIPETIVWFNCIGYCHTPYDYIGGNYFST